jgi:NADH-quinone oxidoreductase E subunit
MARFTAANLERAAAIVARYPVPRSATIPLLHLAQEQDGWITPEAIVHVAELVGASAAEIQGVASFYEMFKEHPTGRYLVGVCTNLSCSLLGGDELLEQCETRLGVRAGGSTADGTFTLEHMECLAACGGAPAVQVNYRYFEHVTPQRMDTILDDLAAGRDPEGVEVPPHGTLSRVAAQLPVPATSATRERPEELHPTEVEVEVRNQ